MKKSRCAILIPTFGACLLTLWAFLFIFTSDRTASATGAESVKERKTVLLAGVDDVGENTDVLLLCTLDKATGEVTLLQIPRDTYYRTEKSEGKINRIFRSYSSKYGRNKAAEALCARISDAFGIPVDGYALFHTHTLGDMTDLLGGVTVDVPKEITYYSREEKREKCIPRGKRTLCGEEAIAFVRHRRDYAEGDLGRLDAQMRFLGGAAAALPRLKKAETLLTIYKKILPNLLTNLGEKDIMEVMMVYLKKREDPTIRLMRLPGEACYTKGAWYYVVSQKAAERMLTSELGCGAGFDREGRLYDSENEQMRNIYTATDATYRVYTAREAAEKRVLLG